VAKTDFKSVDDYIATFAGEDAEGLRAIRKAILSAVPDAEERISYQIPAFYFHGWIFYMSAHQKHFKLACPPPSAAFEAFSSELSTYKMPKSAVILPKNKPLPHDLISRMAAVQAKANLTQGSKDRDRK
jgi:uncharacterized protein YdhG (YjbR/CyaY superfamily)